MRKTQISSRRGFSLVEVVIAIGIVAVLLTTFMAVFGPAQKNINRALGVADANRLVTTLENEMAVLREGEETEYVDANGNASAFEKAFQWIKDSATESSALVVYQYQAVPDSENADGTLKAADLALVKDESKFAGVDYITQTVARCISRNASSFMQDELAPGIVQGKVYAVRMTQLVKGTNSGDGLVLGTPGTIANPVDSDVSNPTDSATYDDAYITLQVEFFPLNNNLYDYVTGGSWEFDKLGAPVATQNIAVRR
ncbi:type II secretion system protein [Rubritalea tangerina]|uniref:Type II secretion system protein n=2 Tax=Rubritalea tangerina TaxID=430798 RepID=A0ABW4ZDN5_9BACT